MNKAQFCEFCQILSGKHRSGSEVITQNEEFFAFHDLDNATAVAHVLVCTKQHIQSALHVKDPSQLFRMKQFATSVLTDIHKKFLGKKSNNDSFRFGFHVPPLISVYHIHLHSFILPFKNSLYQKYKYAFGPNFKSVQEMADLAMNQGRL